MRTVTCAMAGPFRYMPCVPSTLRMSAIRESAWPPTPPPRAPSRPGLWRGCVLAQPNLWAVDVTPANFVGGGGCLVLGVRGGAGNTVQGGLKPCCFIMGRVVRAVLA